MNKEKAQLEFLKWFKQKDPFLYAVTLAAAKKRTSKNNLGGLFDGLDIASIFKSATSVIKDVAPQVVQFQAQKKLLDAQVKRAQSGQPPLDAAAYMANLTPQMQQQINSQSVPNFDPNYMTQQQRESINYLSTRASSGFADTFKTWAPIGIGLASLFLMMSGRKRGR